MSVFKYHAFIYFMLPPSWYGTYIYSPRQKSWPVIHKFNEKSYKQWQKCLVLVDMYRGHKQCWYLVIPPSWIMTSLTLVGMLIFISLPDIGFLNLFWLRVLALWKPGPSLSWFLTVLRGTLALHSSTAALLSSFLRFFLTCSFPLHWLTVESAKDLLLHERLPNKKYLS